jgi:hypothetical protein
MRLSMFDIRRWSPATRAVVVSLWVAAAVGTFIYFQFRRIQTGESGLAAFSIGAGELIAVVILVGPPILVALIWYFRRRT